MCMCEGEQHTVVKQVAELEAHLLCQHSDLMLLHAESPLRLETGCVEGDHKA